MVSEHLPSGYTAEFDGAPAGLSSSAPDLLEHASEESSLKLQGGDIHRDLFKIDARVAMHKRTTTFHGIDELRREEGQDAMTVGIIWLREDSAVHFSSSPTARISWLRGCP